MIVTVPDAASWRLKVPATVTVTVVRFSDVEVVALPLFAVLKLTPSQAKDL
jgi:hypothetical protein